MLGHLLVQFLILRKKKKQFKDLMFIGYSQLENTPAVMVDLIRDIKFYNLHVVYPG